MRLVALAGRLYSGSVWALQGKEWEEVKLDHWKRVKAFQKSLSSLRYSIRQQERVVAPKKSKRKLAAITDDEPGEQVNMEGVFDFLQKSYLPQRKAIGTTDKWESFPGLVMKNNLGDHHQAILKMACVKALMKWTATELKDKPMVSAAISSSTHWSRIRNEVSAGMGVDQPSIFAAPFVSGTPWMEEVFALHVVRCRPGVQSWALPAFCLGAGSVVLEGSAVFLVANVSHITGDTLPKKVESLANLGVEGTTAMLSAKSTPHACFSVSAGDAFVIPHGCIMASTCKDLVCLRWARLTKTSGDLQKVLMSMGLARQAFPKQCVGHFASLMEHVEGVLAMVEAEEEEDE